MPVCHLTHYPLLAEMLNMSRPPSTESVFRAIAHPTRRAIVLHLARRSCPAGELAQLFNHSWATLSRHLHVLTACGVIMYERRGPRLVYQLVPGGLHEIQRWMTHVPAYVSRSRH